MAGERFLYRMMEAKARQTDTQMLVCSQLWFQHTGLYLEGKNEVRLEQDSRAQSAERFLVQEPRP